MKVCILTSSFPRFKKDHAGIFIYHLSMWLAKKGIEVVVISPHDNGFAISERWDGIRIIRFPYFFPLKYQRLCYGAGIPQNVKRNLIAKIQIPLFIISEIIFSLWVIKKLKMDIIHAHWSLPQGLTGLICKNVLKVACVTTLHGSDIHGLRYPILKSLNAKIIKNSDICTANSGATAEMAGDFFKAGKIEIVPMGVDPDFFSRPGNAGALRMRGENDERIILYVGRFIDLKGVDYLIRALPGVLEKYPKTKCLLVGSGPMKDGLISLSKRLNLENKVIFKDKVSQEKLINIYSTANIFILPSIINKKKQTEGLGVVLLEAMACGIPVVGSNVGGIPDIIKDGETGLLTRQKDPDDIAEKVIKLLSDEKLRDKVVENGLNLVRQNFSWEIISDKFLKIYHDVIKMS